MRQFTNVSLDQRTLFIDTNLSIGYTFSTMAQNQAMQMSMMFFLPNILLSGFIFPFAGMPIWAQWIGEALPVCTENPIRIDWRRESPNVSANDRSVIFYRGRFGLAI